MTTRLNTEAGLTGGCQCGNVRYRVDAPTQYGNLCHCRMCQRASGAPFMAFGSAPAGAFEVTRGQMAVFRSSEIAERGFCSACGTPLLYRVHRGGSVGFTLGSLDNPNAIAPSLQYGLESRVKWLNDALSAPASSIAEWLERKDISSVGSRQYQDQEI